ncbi:MAG: restriction endonuclease subunit S [Nitrospirae bacterium]|nr:restriction endonuclease subunit S [Nitrospirota bacterium]
MDEWTKTTLGSLATKIGSGATPRGGENSYKLKGMSLIRSQNVLDFSFSTDGLAFIDDEQAEELRNVTVEANDVLLNITGDSVARCCVVPQAVLPARVNQHVAIIRLDRGKANPLFIFYLLQMMKEELLMQSEIGATRRALTKGMIEELNVVVPALPEQRAIASVLSSLDDKIDLLHRQNKTLEAMAETLFRQWFVEQAQENWEEGTIADLIEFNPSRKLAKGTIAPYLEMAALSTTTFSPDGWYEREFSSGTKFINGDTLLARITPCLENGKAAYVIFLKTGQVGWGSTEYIVMRPKEFLHPFFAYSLCRNRDFRDYAEGCMEGSSGRQRVNVDHLKNYDIKIPSKETVIEFNAFAESAVQKLHANSEQIRTLEKLRDTLLPKLMSGEVRVAV